MDILERIHQQYPTFNKTQRRIADHILQRPDACSFSSLRQIAEATDTTEATVLSFSRRLGYASFSDMRAALQGYISQWMSPNEKIRTALLESASPNDVYHQTIQSDQEALETTYRSISVQEFRKAMGLLRGARRIFAVSHDFPTTLSAHFAARFLRLGVDVVDLGSLSGPDILYRLAFFQPSDLLVAFSYSPYSQLPIALARYFHEKGAHVLCFSDSAACPIARYADALLTSVTQHTLFFNSMTAPISLVTLMASVFVSENQETFQTYKANLDALQKFLLDNNILSDRAGSL